MTSPSARVAFTMGSWSFAARRDQERMSQMLQSLMQDDFPLTLNQIRRRLGSCNQGAEGITLLDDETAQRARHAEVSKRIDRLAQALVGLGVQPGDRFATFAWNNQ